AGRAPGVAPGARAAARRAPPGPPPRCPPPRPPPPPARTPAVRAFAHLLPSTCRRPSLPAHGHRLQDAPATVTAVPAGTQPKPGPRGQPRPAPRAATPPHRPGPQARSAWLGRGQAGRNPGRIRTGRARTRRPPGRPSQSRSVIAATEATSGRRRPLADGVLHAYGTGCLRDPEAGWPTPE